MSALTSLVALILSGVLAGIYVGVCIGDVRIADLDAGQYAAMHQARDATFRRVMPIIGITTVAVLAISALRSAAPLARSLLAAAALLEVLDIAIAIRFQVPRNNAVQAWSDQAPPPGWQGVRDGWEATHRVRTGLGFAVFLATAVALLQRQADLG